MTCELSFGSQGIVVKCTAAIFFSTVDLDRVDHCSRLEGKDQFGVSETLRTEQELSIL